MTAYCVATKFGEEVLGKGFRSAENARAGITKCWPERDPATLAVFGTAGPKDKAAGYRVCMFCLETGDVEGHSAHDVVWDVWEDRMADAKNSAF